MNWLKLHIVPYLIVLLSMVFLAATTSDSYALSIEISGHTKIQGNMFIGLYRKNDAFPEKSGTYKNTIQKVSNTKLTYTFYALPKDTYAIAVFHDQNGNGILDKNLVGVPVERYGFSNNVRGVFSAPSFKEASIKLDENISMKIFIR